MNMRETASLWWLLSVDCRKWDVYGGRPFRLNRAQTAQGRSQSRGQPPTWRPVAQCRWEAVGKVIFGDWHVREKLVAWAITNKKYSYHMYNTYGASTTLSIWKTCRPRIPLNRHHQLLLKGLQLNSCRLPYCAGCRLPVEFSPNAHCSDPA